MAGEREAGGECAEGPIEFRSVAVDYGTLPTATGSASSLLVPGPRRGPVQVPFDAGAIIGQYELIRELGAGGMGAVYLARDVRLGRRVAIKFLAECRDDQASRFLAEARATARCKHDNIVDIYDVGEADGVSYMVLEYLEGITFDAWVRQHWPAGAAQASVGTEPEVCAVSPVRAVELMVPVVRALVHAHSHGLVHRDLKPSNIMLTDSGSIKVLDFGIAKLVDVGVSEAGAESACEQVSDGMTRTDAFVGTLPYMSPEQWGAADVDERTDLWAVGIVFWNLLTGQHPLEPLTRAQLETLVQLDLSMPSICERRPDIGPLGAVIDQCLCKHKQDRHVSAQALLQALEPLRPGRDSVAVSSGDPTNPFVGLAAFQRADTGRFFGRDRDIASLMAQLRNHRLVTVAGPSGAGKSSFIRAGVIPALERSGQHWETFIVRPGREPLVALATVLAQISRAMTRDDRLPEATSDDAFVGDLRTQPGYLGTVMRARCQGRSTRILLFIDQFEELYTLSADRETRETFVRCLEGVADDASSPLRVVLSVRSDFLDRVAEDRAFTNEIIRGLSLLAPLSREQLCEALTRPLEAAGYRFEDEALVQAMLDSLEVTRSPLPLLQFAAARLWETRDAQRKQISRASYERLGGIEGALATHADAVVAGLSRAEQRIARSVFTTLVSDDRTRAIVTVEELRVTVRTGASETVDDAEALERVIRHLSEARLVMLETDAEVGSLIELTHESLIERWPMLVQWLDEDQDAVHFRSRLRAAARQWDKQQRSEDLLWRGRLADEAELWLERDIAGRTELAVRDEQYLRAVARLATRTRLRRRLLLGFAFAVMTVVAVVVSVLAARAERQARHARASAAQARNASRMASASQHSEDATLVLALMREMEPEGSPPRLWRQVARRASYQDVAPVVLNHPDQVFAAAFSPDGAVIVTGAGDNTVRLWPSDGYGEPTLLGQHDDRIYAVAFSPDGSRLVTGSWDQTVRLWRPDGSEPPRVLSGHSGKIYAVAYSPDGSRIASASWDKTVRIWPADGVGEPVVLHGPNGRLFSVAFSPDGQHVVAGSEEGAIWIWEVDGGAAPVALVGHEGMVYTAAYSPDGSLIVSGALDKTTRLWDTATGQALCTLPGGHGDLVYSAEFSPDGAGMVTASWDNTVRAWAPDCSGRSQVIGRHRDRIYAAQYSSDGARIVTASLDRSVRVWDATGVRKPVQLRGHGNRIKSAGFSPDSRRVVTASLDGTARIWNADGTGEPTILAGHDDWVVSAAFSPDGERIVTASKDATARVWSVDGSGEPVVLRGHQAHVNGAAFSPDGTRVITASRDGTARIWHVDGAGEPLVLAGHEGWVNGASFSPDGAQVVTAAHDGLVRIWNADGSGTPTVLAGHTMRVNSAAFSPDGTLLLSASSDRTARVWNLVERAVDGLPKVVVLTGHGDTLMCSGSVAGQGGFSPDGQRVVTISDDQTVRLWNADGTGQPAVLRMPELDAYSAAFSPDGKLLATTSHIAENPATGEAEHWVTIWPVFHPYTGLDDPSLWNATTYCPPADMRVEMLGVPLELAQRQVRNCQRRVAAAR